VSLGSKRISVVVYTLKEVTEASQWRSCSRNLVSTRLFGRCDVLGLSIDCSCEIVLPRSAYDELHSSTVSDSESDQLLSVWLFSTTAHTNCPRPPTAGPKNSGWGCCSTPSTRLNDVSAYTVYRSIFIRQKQKLVQLMYKTAVYTLVNGAITHQKPQI